MFARSAQPAWPSGLGHWSLLQEWLPQFPRSCSPRHIPCAATTVTVLGAPSLAPTYIKKLCTWAGAKVLPSSESVQRAGITCSERAEDTAPWRALAQALSEASVEKSLMTSNQWWLAAKLWQCENRCLLFCSPCLPAHFLAPSLLFSWPCTPNTNVGTFATGSAFWGAWTKTVCNGTQLESDSPLNCNATLISFRLCSAFIILF